ncbi:MAG: HEAT repeat domain-containing protein [Candidatus Heimdallarchaeota archaeon]
MDSHEKTLTEYIEDLSSSDSRVRIDAAIILGEWGNDRAVKPLIECLFHEDDNFRREAARALKEIGNRRAIEPLVDVLMDDSYPEVRAEAAYDLGYFEGAKAFADSLIQALSTDGHYLVRQNAAFALGKLGSRKSVRPLLKVLQEEENYNVRENAAWALGEIKDKRAIEGLISATDDSHIAVRKKAAYALGRLKAVIALSVLQKQLTKKDEAKEAAWAISKIAKKSKAVSILKDACKRMKKDKIPVDSVEICRILISLDKKTGQQYIDKFLTDDTFKFYHSELKTLLYRI